MNGCGINTATGFCDSCGCFSAEIGNGEWFCIAAEQNQLQHQRDKDEDDRYGELEF